MKIKKIDKKKSLPYKKIISLYFYHVYYRL